MARKAVWLSVTYHAKCSKCVGRWGSAPDPAGELTMLPKTPNRGFEKKLCSGGCFYDSGGSASMTQGGIDAPVQNWIRMLEISMMIWGERVNRDGKDMRKIIIIIIITLSTEVSERSNCRLVPYWREFLGVSGSRTWSDTPFANT